MTTVRTFFFSHTFQVLYSFIGEKGSVGVGLDFTDTFSLWRGKIQGGGGRGGSNGENPFVSYR